MSRPFLRRPTPAEWSDLVAEAIDDRAAGELDLFVVDPIASFLPGRSESDAGTLLEMLHPLQRLAATGAAVLLLHHPRKERADVSQISTVPALVPGTASEAPSGDTAIRSNGRPDSSKVR